MPSGGAALAALLWVGTVVLTLMSLLLLRVGGTAQALAPQPNGGGEECQRTCGEKAINYPFGVGPAHCSFSPHFRLHCRAGKLFLGRARKHRKHPVEILNISLPSGEMQVMNHISSYCYNASSGNMVWHDWYWNLTGTPYTFSHQANKFTVMGCRTLAYIGNDVIDYMTGCVSLWLGGTYPTIDCSNGIGCCQTTIPMDLRYYQVLFDTGLFRNSSGLESSCSCSYAVLMDSSNFTLSTDYLTSLEHFNDTFSGRAPMMLQWAIGDEACDVARKNTTGYACVSDNSNCSSAASGQGYICKCKDGFHGNPYLRGPDGCIDIDECKYPDQYVCYGVCKNTPGSYICQCNTGYTGNASIPNGCTDIDECKHKEAYSCYGICQNLPGSFHCQCPEGSSGNYSIKGGCITIKNSFTGLSIGLGVGGGTSLLLVALGGPYIMRKIKLQKVKKMKQMFFKQNRGLLLQQLISHNTDISERMIITLSGIQKATNNFDRARIIGGGGHGVVFKGILDLQVVAVKKSKIVVQREINEFINEVAVLSQVNHRNVVKLLGCCLETEVPLLVYEFISNGTLCHHLHIDGPISLSWDDRMRIAAEVAKALSYLHSAASMPIFHRDIKSANILLDDALTAKVSDFGASRYIPTDQTGVTTAVQGTMGYLDPMYYYTGRLTDKSDVFSFGVILVELLTRKKPYVYRSVDNDGLVSHFVSLLAEGKVGDIIDPQVMEEESGEIQEVATLAAMCTKLKGEDRPTMREVEMTLESLLVKKRQVQYNRTPMRNGGDEATAHYMATSRDCKETSRQYTMEAEILLSASYPR